ncbi:carbohydrate kinase family protein [Ovoidimarina sediminis]|uniref:carbohydrate kinase family protein n=1 Tax=Ovoidimarina sediminis TaxID=3079856 RepID=UPI00290C7153|nr:carbohydrate kinase [Rhodophyticola sp. MJ-SS7]MDU8945177.1 carbohydrate kinase [Rhodophyticola sp. MJ-SS7]
MILNAGEALIDMLPRETADGETAFAPYAGGSVFNTAIALGRLGAPSGFFSGLSTDLFGSVLEEALATSKVDAGLAHRSDRPTTLAFVTLTDGQARYAFYDENTAGRMLTPADLPDLPESVTACFFGGISLMVEPCATAYAALLEREAGRRVIMLDPNIRPSFIRDEAAYRARILRLIGLADIVKLSDEDLAWLEGDGDIDAAAGQILARGPKLVCITEGAKGARGVTASGSTFVASSPVKVADTVGAGDTFNAGVLAALHAAGALTKPALDALDETTIADALSLGARAAAVTVSRAGANPPWAEELA